MLHCVCHALYSTQCREKRKVDDSGCGKGWWTKALRKGWSVLRVWGFGPIPIGKWGTSRLKASSAHPGIRAVPFHSLWPRQEQKLPWTSENLGVAYVDAVPPPSLCDPAPHAGMFLRFLLLLLSLYLAIYILNSTLRTPILSSPRPRTVEEKSPYQGSHRNSHIDLSGCIWSRQPLSSRKHTSQSRGDLSSWRLWPWAVQTIVWSKRLKPPREKDHPKRRWWDLGWSGETLGRAVVSFLPLTPKPQWIPSPSLRLVVLAFREPVNSLFAFCLIPAGFL